MEKKNRILGGAGEKVLLTGNEAIARGCLEAGVVVATAYPGTPATTIMEKLGEVAPELGFHAELSVNEAVAFEVAAGAAMAGVRSLMATKMLGVNLIADPLTVISVTGVRAGLVIVTADDPQQFSSQNAEDTRFFGMLAKVPVLEPMDGQEAKDMARYAFELSEELELPVFLRITPRICHSSFPVEFGEVRRPKRNGKFVRDPKRFVMISTYSRPRQKLLNEKIIRARSIADTNPWNRSFNFQNGMMVDPGKVYNTFGIIASGMTFPYVQEVLEVTKVNAKVLKLATTYPLPENLITEFLREMDQVLIVEENDGVTELLTRALAQRKRLNVRIMGKDEGLIPMSGELNPDIVGDAMEKLFGIKFREDLTEAYLKAEKELVSQRVPALCAGCPHRSSYYSIREALRRKGRGGSIMGDRGCYNQGAYEPLEGIDSCICMGASIAMASGISHSGTNEPVLSVIGDGTFYHSGIPSLLNAVHNRSNIVSLIFDNSITAMTGHQMNPGTGINLMGESTGFANLKKIVQACGVERVQVISAFDTKKLIEAVMEEIDQPGPSVIISRAPCALVVERNIRKRKMEMYRAEVDLEKCIGCKACMKKIGCPAFGWSNEPKPHLEILPHCNGCGLCVETCPFGAISVPGKPDDALGISVKHREVKS
ncbi:MAG: indolepyruvate ferredoxin oxidoreductase subunit alpha [Candidatus Thermoplasmatota archaeon]|nr:indolepyruvate ferredoxin oxidoreductase subunit alpha [Candidatus Thermoplasmatota archaeon]